MLHCECLRGVYFGFSLRLSPVSPSFHGAPVFPHLLSLPQLLPWLGGGRIPLRVRSASCRRAASQFFLSFLSTFFSALSLPSLVEPSATQCHLAFWSDPTARPSGAERDVKRNRVEPEGRRSLALNAALGYSQLVRMKPTSLRPLHPSSVPSFPFLSATRKGRLFCLLVCFVYSPCFSQTTFRISSLRVFFCQLQILG